MTASKAIPVGSEKELDDFLSIPQPALIEWMKKLSGDIIFLGVAGKMGLTMSMAARRAADEAGVKKRIIGVSRFSNSASRKLLEDNGIETVPCNLLDPEDVKKLPLCENVIFLAGRKFGTDGEEAMTWASNTILPANVGFHYRKSRIVAFSTGCVYPLVNSNSGGCDEQVRPAPIGEYAQSCLGRERVFEYISRTYDTPVCLIRLNYSVELRYGVLHDIARKILDGQPVDVSVPMANVIWQADANQQAIGALDLCESPAAVLNITGPETFSIRKAALKLGKYMEMPVSFAGEEKDLAYLNDASKAAGLFGYPSVGLDNIIRWTAEWLKNGGASLGKATHYEVNTGKF